MVQTPFIKDRSIGQRNSKWVKAMLFQLRSDFSDWQIRDGLYYFSNLKKLTGTINAVLKIAEREKINLLIFPECSVPEELMPVITEWSTNRETIVIAGSHYHSTGNDVISRCPIVYKGNVDFTHKIIPSKDEGNVNYEQIFKSPVPIINVTNSPVGSFAVLICADNLNETIRNECLKLNPDFLIVIAFQKDSYYHFHRLTTTIENDTFDGYCIYCNNLVVTANQKYASDGRSSIWGVVDKTALKQLIDAGKTDFFPVNKLCELPNEKDCLVISFDIDNKTPALKSKIKKEPHNISGVTFLNIEGESESSNSGANNFVDTQPDLHNQERNNLLKKEIIQLEKMLGENNISACVLQIQKLRLWTIGSPKELTFLQKSIATNYKQATENANIQNLILEFITRIKQYK